MLGFGKRPNSQKIGCGFMLFSGVIIVVLLVLNGLFVRMFFSINLSGLDDNIFQAAQFILPIVMIFIEFWLYDLLTFRKRNQQADDTD